MGDAAGEYERDVAIAGAAMSFQSDMARAAANIERKAERTRQRAVAVSAHRIVEDTTVLTGRLQAQWRASVGRPKFVYDEEDVDSTEAVQSVINTTVTLQGGQTMYLANGAPYAHEVEMGAEGDSNKNWQQPMGWVRIDAGKWLGDVVDAALFI